MPLNPAGSTLSFTLSASSYSADVIINDMPYSFTIEKFKRIEFSHEKLMSAKNADGSKAQLQPNADGKPVQVQSTCAVSPIRDVTPDDSVVNQILQKFNINEWQIEGSASSPSAVDTLFTISQDHKKKLLVFDAYQEYQGMDVSVQFLLGLQLESFSYLTTTGLTMSGVGTGMGTVNNCLITDFKPAVLYRDTITGLAVAKGWSMTVQQRTLANQNSLA